MPERDDGMTSPLDEDPMGPVIVRVLAGSATPADEGELRAWLAADPTRERELDELRAAWSGAGLLHQGWNTAPVQERILRALDGNVVPIRREGRLRLLRPRAMLSTVRSRSWAAAGVAALLALTAAGFLTWRLGPARERAAAPAAPRLAELATRRGEQAVLRLSDGTRITLGVDSRLCYPEALAGGAGRDVYLEGEAFFEVARDTLRPFRVHAGDATTRVLGTRFAVRAYPEDGAVRVVVAEGVVSLGAESGGNAPVTLERGDLGELAAGAVPVVSHGADLSLELAWVERRLVFAETPLSEVVRRLSRWYDVDVRLGDRSLAGVPYTMSPRGDETVEQVLRVIAPAVGARLERRGTAYVFLPRTEVR